MNDSANKSNKRREAMKVKTVKCKEGQMGKCPVCGKIFSDDKSFKPCSHVLAWYDSVDGSWGYIRAPIRKTIELLYEDTGVGDKDALVRLFGTNKDVIMIIFDEGYIGGDMYVKNLVAFRKEKASIDSHD
jgi:hypothetical protein